MSINLRKRAALSFAAVVGLSVLAAACSQPKPPPPKPVAPPVALAPSVLDQAGGYYAYVKQAGAISPKFANGGDVAQSLKAGAAYEPRQFLRGAIAYGAVAALQDPAFVAGVKIYAGNAEQRRQKIRQAMADFFKSRQPPANQGSLPFAGTRPSPAGAGFGRGPATSASGSGFRIPGSAPPVPGFADGRPGSSRPGHGDESRSSCGELQSALPEPGRPITAGPAPIPQSEIRNPQSPAPEPDDAVLRAAFRADRVLQVHASYLVAETPEGMVIIDQHALHERILYEQLHDQISRGPLEAQRLLLPETVEISPEQMGVLEVHGDLLRRLGLELTAFGPGTVAVHACPSLLRGPSVPGFVRDLIEKLSQQSGRSEPEAMLQEILAMTACKAAIKAGDPLSPEEIVALLAQAERVEKSTNCPHGRPTSLRLTVADLERQFKRT